jgi:hypothetical protein
MAGTSTLKCGGQGSVRGIALLFERCTPSASNFKQTRRLLHPVLCIHPTKNLNSVELCEHALQLWRK